jgi:hypothetical protein
MLGGVGGENNSSSSTTSMSFTSLPLEVIEQIVACVSDIDEEEKKEEEEEDQYSDASRARSLEALSCVNRMLHNICLPVIWQVSCAHCRFLLGITSSHAWARIWISKEQTTDIFMASFA